MVTDSHVAELRHRYEKADSFAREVGELRSEVLIPASNELRYAGHHLLQSINDDGAIDDVESIRKAKSHCERAMYEAAEAGIMFCVDSIKSFEKDYEDMAISEVIHDYPQRRVRVQRALDLIIKGRSGRKSVEDHVDAYMEEFRAVREILQLCDASRDDLNVKRRREVRDQRKFVTRIVLMLLTILLAVLGIAVST